MVTTSLSPAIVVFIERACRYKAIAAQILHDYQLVTIPYTSRKFLPHWDYVRAASSGTSSK
jgi:hypothetical protein